MRNRKKLFFGQWSPPMVNLFCLIQSAMQVTLTALEWIQPSGHSLGLEVGKVLSNVADAGCLDRECGLGAFQAGPACARLAGSPQGPAPVSPGF